MKPLDVATAARFARMALDCIPREYPNKVAHILSSDDDMRPPRLLCQATSAGKIAMTNDQGLTLHLSP